MNIHYTKIFKVNFYEVVHAILTLSVINITTLVNFFLCYCYRCLKAHQGFGKVAQNQGCGGGVPSRQQLLRYSLKKNTLFTEKGRAVLLVQSLIDNTKIF